MDVAQAVLAVLVGLIGAVLGFLVKRRVNTGTVQTSDAQALWEEGRQMRDALRDRVRDLELRLEKKDVELAAVKAERDGLLREVAALRMGQP